MTAVMRCAPVSPICERKYLKTAIRVVGLQDAQASGTWLTMGMPSDVVHQMPEPTHQEVEQLASRIAERSEKVMRQHGRWVDEDSADIEPEQLSLEYPALSACYGASVRAVDDVRASGPSVHEVAVNTACGQYR